MTDRPRLTSIDLWQRHEQRCLQLLRAAIVRLDAGPADEGEPELNRRLYRAIIAVQAADARDGLEQLSVVVPEGRNPPATSDAQLAPRERKIPDFYWAYVDYLDPDPDDAVACQFVVECKRLTASTRGWDYIAQYIHAGILRFVTEEHGYGKGTASGAMLAYLQNIDTDQALREVNAQVMANGLPVLTVRDRTADALIELHHQLVRLFPDSPFLLTHLWTRVAAAAPSSVGM
jgi:RimJ/RimL family protein N-acetyltransferase